MLNLLWGAMMLIGILYGAVTGRLAEVTDAALSCAKEAVALCITMSGIVAAFAFFISQNTKRTSGNGIYFR